jgi:hypothetical protein
MTTPDAYVRALPPHNYNNGRPIKDPSNRVHSNALSNTNSFVDPSKIQGGTDSKWDNLNNITQGQVKNNKVRNNPLRNKNGMAGLTHDFGTSLSAQEKKRAIDRIKNHKLSVDSTLLNRNGAVLKLRDSPSNNKRRQNGSLACKNNKYNENEVLKDYLNSKRQHSINPLYQLEENLNYYFSSLDFPYNEVKSYLENNDSIPRMNTRESHETNSNRVILYPINNTGHSKL